LGDECGTDEPCGGHPLGCHATLVCASRLASMLTELEPGEARKVVTVLFSDVAGSTVLGQELDPESLRRLLVRYFQEMRAILQRHGGTTEKFIGDAVMAVFGVPRLHEDDALRAVRAAVEMREALHHLNDEFEGRWGVRILVRIGVSTGEVIAGDPAVGESFVVGEAVNLAARLEQVAEPGQILIGDPTYRLVQNAARVQPLPPLSIKGMTEPVLAWSLLEVRRHVPGWTRRLDSPLVGRGQELRVLEETFRRSTEGRSGELVTVLGAPGVGKSRLANEFLSRLGSGPQLVSGRCLSYGEGITFWPMVEVLREAAGVSDADSPDAARPKILKLLEHTEDAQLIGERLAALLGLSDVTPGIQETFWALRKFFEVLATRRPLVVVLDDVHWGEPTFLDLLEYLVDWLDGLPMMLLCLSRVDLLEAREMWMTGKPNASSVTLAPLSMPETEMLVGSLLGSARPPDQALTQLAAVAEGNPLFVEETLRMLMDDGRLVHDDGWIIAADLSTLTIPPTIHALLSARLDRLEQEERAVLELAAIVGRQFSSGAIAELSSAEVRTGMGGALRSLTQKELIRPDRVDLSAEDAFQFTHILIRDAAYRGNAQGGPGRPARAVRRLDPRPFPGHRRRIRRDHRLPPRAGPPDLVGARADEPAAQRPGASRRHAARLGRPAGVRPRGHARRRQPAVTGGGAAPGRGPAAPTGPSRPCLRPTRDR
jgi:class 3 adenylate cyclase